jgi:hypothetical protein
MEQSTWEAKSHSDNQEIPRFYGPRSFSIVFTRAHNLSLSWASWILFPLLMSLQRTRSIQRPCVTFALKNWFLRWGVVSPSTNPKAGGPPSFGCQRLLIQYIRSYLPYMAPVFSIRNLKTRYAMVTGTHITWAIIWDAITTWNEYKHC